MFNVIMRAAILAWELAGLPFHSWRLASMNAEFRHHRHYAIQAFDQEQALLRAFIREVRGLEEQLADAVSELGLHASRQAVMSGAHASLRRLREQYDAMASTDLSGAQTEHAA
jgi:hypothetical protein